MGTTLTSKQIERLNQLIEFCPEIPTNGYIMRSQIKDFVDTTGSSWPTFITNQTPLSRGMYPIPGSTIKQSEGEPQIMNEAQPAASVQNVLPMNQHNKSIQSNVDVNHSMVHDQISSVNVLIPEKDPNYIPFGCYSDLDKIISSKIFAPVYITGHSGTGKNVMVEQLCAKHKRPMIRINMHNQMTEEDLIGSKTLIDGNIQVVEGPLLIAMRTGSVCVLDECLEENEEVRIGTINEWESMKLKDLEFGVEYKTPSFNMETGEFENDTLVLHSEREAKIFEVELEDGRTILVTDNHPFIVQDGDQFIEKSILDGLNSDDLVVVMN